MKAARALAAPAVDDDQLRLAALFDAHADRLYRLARRLTASKEDARDRVQETFLRAAKSLRAVPLGLHAEEAWLVRVLVNIQRDEWRKGAVRVRAYPAHRTDAPDIESVLDAKRIVWRTLAALNPRRRAVIVMRDLEGRPISEIAQLLGIATVTVRWHLSRGRRELRRLLKGDT
ncbi:MAG TPA: RNA polymerase sigma factor [Vicinamibacterales bacterium]|jgi:RNA polymerase sigma-70 factor (ECF subfamily)